MKKPTLSIDLPIHAHLSDFFDVMLARKDWGPKPSHSEYVSWCRERVKKYPTTLPEYWNVKNAVNPYCFTQVLSEELKENELIVTGDGTACVVTFQATHLKKGQRLFTNSGCASMGFDLPAAIGAWWANRPERIVCIAGDGSIMMNLQELQTLLHHKIPVKLFIFNNKGYHSIRQTQRNFFPDNIVGCGTESGLSFPDFEKLAAAFGYGYQRIRNHDELRGQIQAAVNASGPVICEVMLDLEQQFAPKTSSRRLPDGRMVTAPLEDMAPFLSREELKQNMIVPLVEDPA
jgi:acetolactate synthase-1/2/3 large subunit